MEWREMGRLAREVGWEIEKRIGMEGGDGELITLHGMKKNLADEKRGREEEKKGRVEERRMKEEEKSGREAEKRKREAVEREKRELEERLRHMELLVQEMKYRPILSLDGASVTFPQTDYIKREGNTIIHHGPDMEFRNCFIGGVMTSV